MITLSSNVISRYYTGYFTPKVLLHSGYTKRYWKWDKVSWLWKDDFYTNNV